MVLAVALLNHFIIILSMMLLAEQSLAETIQLDVGAEQVQIVSSSYQKSSSNVGYFAASYGRQLMGRWSGFAEYRNTFDGSVSAGILGLAYDSIDLKIKGGLISGDGTPEISRVPIWLTRMSIGIGTYRLVDVLRSNDPSLGTRNLVPVKASLVGVKLGVAVHRFFRDYLAATAGGVYELASAGNFGVSATSFYLGVMYNID